MQPGAMGLPVEYFIGSPSPYYLLFSHARRIGLAT